MTDNLKSILTYKVHEYGSVRVKLAELLAERGITRNRLHMLTGVKNDVIDRYYKAENVMMVDLDFLAKVCFVLDCTIDDLLEYQKPEIKQEAEA